MKKSVKKLYKKQKKSIKSINVYFILIIVVSIIFLLSLIYLGFLIYKQSWISYEIACSNNYKQVLEDNNVMIGGYVTIIQQGVLNTDNITNIQNYSIINDTNYKYEIKLINNDTINYKHEVIHINQMVRGYPSLECSEKNQKILSEVEAYIFSYLPDYIFYKIYNKY